MKYSIRKLFEKRVEKREKGNRGLIRSKIIVSIPLHE